MIRNKKQRQLQSRKSNTGAQSKKRVGMLRKKQAVSQMKGSKKMIKGRLRKGSSYNSAYDKGFDEAYNEGFNAGYQKGMEHGSQESLEGGSLNGNDQTNSSI